MDWGDLLCAERPRRSSVPTDARDEFERDFDRAVFSTPVKRLQDKAQVFPLEPNDSVRTRLTHSLEVSSVARGLARAIGKVLQRRDVLTHEQVRSLEAIAATCGLIHDLGNPPFGHAGERAITEWFAKKCEQNDDIITSLIKQKLLSDFQNFDGNAQTMRLVSKLQILADNNGLNMTYGTLSASRKYLASCETLHREKHFYSKLGYFNSEKKIIDAIKEKTKTGEHRNPITFFVEAADDIVYSAADIEDAIKKGIISWNAVESYLKENSHDSILQALEVKKRILSTGSLPGEPSNFECDINASAFRTAAISVFVKSAVTEFESNVDSILTGSYEQELIKKFDAAPFIKVLKNFACEYIYCTPPTLKLEIMGKNIICDLLDVFFDGVKELGKKGKPKTKSFSGKIAALLSKNYVAVFQQDANANDEMENYYRMQVVTDYICGMTDTFAMKLHKELFNG